MNKRNDSATVSDYALSIDTSSPTAAESLRMFTGQASEAGRIWIEDGKLFFSGDVDESAKVLLNIMQEAIDEAVRKAVLAERRECAALANYVDKSTHPADLADMIRARPKHIRSR